MPDDPKGPTTSQLLRAYERLESIKTKFVKAGLLDGDATPAQVIDKLRQILPPDLLN